MLCIYVMDNPKKWENYLHLKEFSYDNGHETSTNLIPFEIVYGRKCHTYVTWDNPMDIIMIGPDIINELEQSVNIVRKILKMD